MPAEVPHHNTKETGCSAPSELLNRTMLPKLSPDDLKGLDVLEGFRRWLTIVSMLCMLPIAGFATVLLPVVP